MKNNNLRLPQQPQSNIQPIPVIVPNGTTAGRSINVSIHTMSNNREVWNVIGSGGGNSFFPDTNDFECGNCGQIIDLSGVLDLKSPFIEESIVDQKEKIKYYKAQIINYKAQIINLIKVYNNGDKISDILDELELNICSNII